MLQRVNFTHISFFLSIINEIGSATIFIQGVARFSAAFSALSIGTARYYCVTKTVGAGGAMIRVLIPTWSAYKYGELYGLFKKTGRYINK